MHILLQRIKYDQLIVPRVLLWAQARRLSVGLSFFNAAAFAPKLRPVTGDAAAALGAAVAERLGWSSKVSR
jgi:hypothetical protein